MYTVTIITKNEDSTMVERAGVRGEKVFISFAGSKGIKMNPKPRKIEGWKTCEGAMNFISECLKIDIENGRNSYYQIEVE